MRQVKVAEIGANICQGKRVVVSCNVTHGVWNELQIDASEGFRRCARQVDFVGGE